MSNGTPPPQNPPDRFDQIEAKLNVLTNSIDSLVQAVGAVKTATDKTQKDSALLPLWCALVAALIGALAAIGGSLITAHSTIEASQKTLESAAKVAFESARGSKSSEDYKNAKQLITDIEIGFRESAVQRSVKKSLEDGLAKLSSLALGTFKSGVPSLAALTTYAAQLLADYSAKKKHWEDYEQAERPKIEDLCENARAELEDWAKNQK